MLVTAKDLHRKIIYIRFMKKIDQLESENSMLKKVVSKLTK